MAWPQETGFRSEGETRRTPRITAQSDGLACFHILVFIYNLLGQVSIDSFQTILMTDYHVLFHNRDVRISPYAHFPLKAARIVSPM